MSDRTDPRPNVLVIMSDQHSKFHIGCYGDNLVRTPHMDRMAAEGMHFDNVYCASPICVPSRMAFMTARRPSANRVWTNHHILSSAIPTWAHAMGAAGYETALVGRMHFVGSDQRHGFERRPIGEYCAQHPGASWEGSPRFRKMPPGVSGQGRVSVEHSGYGLCTYQAYDDMVVDSAIEYLDEKARDPGNRPFAAVAGFVLPHCPYIAPTKELFDYYYERVDVPQPTPEERRNAPEGIRKIKHIRDLENPLPEERIRVARAAYFAMCEYFDSLVGRMLQKLEETGLDRNTLVVYCSDHGEMAGEHGLWSKGNYYEASVSVPMIARLPGVIPAGSVNDAICNLMDIGPTLVDMAGSDPMPATDGRSMWPLWRGEPIPDWTDETFSEHHWEFFEAPSRMIRKGPWKLYQCNESTPPALFNLDDDPEELNDLGQDPRYGDIRETLMKRLYDGWDPAHVREEMANLDRDMRLISSWGKAVQPVHEDIVAVPDVEDIVLC